MIAKERLYLTADKTTVVKEGDARAAYLLIAKGQEISQNVLRRYGLSSEEGKELTPAEDKESAPPEDKGGLKIPSQALRVTRPAR